MKIKNTLLIVVVLVIAVLFFEKQASAAIQAPSTPPAGSTLEQRVELRKKEQAIILDEKDKTRLIQRCVAAQSKIRVVVSELVPASKDRFDAHRQVDGKLLIGIGQLKLSGKDTFNLQKQHSELATKISQFSDTYANLRQALDDTATINCKNDPEAFKAMLETSRLYYSQWRVQSADINSYYVNTIKPTIADFITQLTPKTTNTN